MKSLARPFYLLTAFILVVGLACSAGTSASPTPTSSGGGAALPTANTSGAGATSLQDAQKATIQIESEGTFVDPQVGLEVNAAGRGSGFIIDPSGLAVTNNHVVTGAALVKVWVGGESSPRNARVVAASECSDLALIDIEGDGYPTMSWDTQPAKIGEEVYAAGFPLGEPQFSLTKGIISKTDAPGQTSWSSLDGVLGHDATLNPGNSGGPLITADGRVIGVNYSSRASVSQYFAIPASVAMNVVDQLKKGQDFESIGINGSAVASQDGKLTGIWVSSVKSGSAADKARIQAGDIIYQLEGIVLGTDGTMKDYCDILRSHQPSDTMSLQVIRFGTGELLEGQLNGRELAVTGSFDVSGSGGGSAGGTTATQPPAGNAQDFFTEEFDGDLANWKYFTKGTGSDANLSLSQNNGSLVVDVGDKDLYVYLYYDPYTYSDVNLTMQAENQGRNNNNVSLVCRYDAEKDTWYEFSVESGGVWYLYAHDGEGYHNLDSGGVTALKQGKETNLYGLMCNGRDITMGVNGDVLKTVHENSYGFREGRVGFNISSLNVLPVTVAVDWFDIAKP